MSQPLIVNEIYRTLQGEGVRSGRPCAIVRLTGCNLRCTWCDTTYAYDQGREMSVSQVVQQVRRLAVRLVLVTGGEPLLQPATPALLERLCEEGLEVLLETNGSQDISAVDGRVGRCLDVKCPGSGQAASFRWPNLQQLRPGDEVKFILADRGDYEYARGVIRQHRLTGRCPVILTAAAGRLEPAELADWMLADPDLPPDVRLGLQLQKILWPGRRRGV
jgi:7-carboxy-7-deazaguanine synthase